MVGLMLGILVVVVFFVVVILLFVLMVLIGCCGWIVLCCDFIWCFWWSLGVYIVCWFKIYLFVSVLVLVILVGCVGLVWYNYDDCKMFLVFVESLIGYVVLDKYFLFNLIIFEYLFI